MKISKILTFLISLPKTLYFNFLAFPINTAIKLPVFVSYNVRSLQVKKGVLQFPNGARPFQVRIGAGGSLGLPTQKSSMRISSGSLIFKGKAKIGGGCFY